MAFDHYHKWLGIPAAEQPPNHYRLLAINPFEDDPDVIESAADRQMAHVRTFQGGPHSADSQKLLNELSAAKICLLDPQKRATYDVELRRPMLVSPPVVQRAPPQPAALPPGPAPVRPASVLVAAPEPPAEFIFDRNTASRSAGKGWPGRRRNCGWPAAAAVALAAAGLAGYLIWTRPDPDLVVLMPPGPAASGETPNPDPKLPQPDPRTVSETPNPNPEPKQQADPRAPDETPNTEPKPQPDGPPNSYAKSKTPVLPADVESFTGHKYKFYPQRVTWKEARDRCELLGGSLAVIDSLAENAFVGELVAKANWQDTWIGATDEAEEGRWRTIAGERLTFSNWFTNQPNNKSNAEHYALMSNRFVGGTSIGWRWSDQPNVSEEHQPGFVCEWASSSAADSEGFVPLFNGKDLTGWKTHPRQPGNWRVDNGILVGSGPAASHLYSESGNFANFHLRVEARINDGGNGGVYCRSQFGPVWPENNPKILDGYEAQINSTHADKNKTGSLYGPAGAVVTIANSIVRPKEWFTLTLIAVDNHIVVKVNGQTTADYFDSARRFPIGHLALQQHDPQTVVEFRKIEIRENSPQDGIQAAADQALGATRPLPRFACETEEASRKDWSVQGDELVQKTLRGANGSILIFGDPAWNEYDFSVEAKMVEGNNVFSLLFGFESRDEHFNYALGGWGNKTCDVTHSHAGRATHPAKQAGALVPGRWHQAEVRVRGTKYDCYFDGKRIFELASNGEVHGKVGLWTWGAAYRFRNIVVKAPDGKVLLEGLPDLDSARTPAARSPTTHNEPTKPAEPSPKPPSLGDLANDKGLAEKGKLTATEVFTLKDQHKAAVTRLAFHQKLPVLASAGKDGRVLLWNLQTGAWQSELHKFNEEVWTIEFSPDGNLLALANRNWWGSRLVFKTLAGQQANIVKDFKNGGGAVASIAYSRDGRLFAAGQDDGTIRLWDVAQARELPAIGLGERHNIYGLAFGNVIVDRKRKSAGYLLAAGGEDGMVRTFTATFNQANGGQTSFQQTNVQFPQAGALLGMRFSADGEILGCARRGGDISLHNPQTGAHIRTLAGGQGGGDPVHWIAFHSQKPWCITAHQNAQVARIWNTATAELLCELKGHTGGLLCAEFSPDGQFVATASEDFSVKLWKLDDPNAPAPKKRAKRR